MTISVCIFARNEERLLPRNIGALDGAGLSLRDQTHILVNGSTDNTSATARLLAIADSRITTHELPIGDKANAWNEYVHRIADPEIATHVFLDGDITASHGAINALQAALTASADCYAAAALPAAGRNQRGWARRLLIHHFISGNLYALSGSVIRQFRERQIRLPFGAKGEDGLLSYLLLTDLKGGEDDSHTDRITIAEDATFEFDSLQANVRDFKLYCRRLRRYSERHFQKKILYRRLKETGVSAMPDSIYEIYTDEALAALQPRLDPVNFWFDSATIKHLRARKSLARATV